MISILLIPALLACFVFSATFSTTTASLADCLSSARVPASLPGSSNYKTLSLPYNLRLQYMPAAIALPTTPQHVSSAVLCAASSKIKVQAKSGGHSYASYSSGGQNGSMVISLESFQTVAVDSKGVAQVGGGARLGNIATGIYNQSKRALPHGVCPGVGIGGHATHGGYWYSSRRWGLTLDTIVALDVVLANGSFIHATSTSYTDIYWALRGAADSIGIVTTFYFQTQAAPPSVVNWVYEIPMANPTVAANAFSHIQSFSLNASVIDDKTGLGVTPSPSSFHISGTYHGDEATFRSKIAPEFLRTLPAPSSTTIKTLPWLDSLADMWGSPLPQPLTGYNAHDNFYAKSILVPESTPLTPSALLNFFTYIATNGSATTGWFSELNLLGGPASRVNNPLSPPSAYSARNSLWVVQNYATVPAAASANGITKPTIDFVKGLNEALGMGYGGYPNYVDPELSAGQAHGVYFSEGVYERLRGVKRAVDPEGVFWNPQAVGT
ncbi:MAG: hypothetical protein LQ349_006042 [Xanthoria aureola]|nr:MAG: hypothetical protein LQ349_006042 [Xanthoria aureola]